MLSNNANYHMDDAINEIQEKRAIVDAKIDSQVVLQLLVQKGRVTREEVEEMRGRVRNSTKYKATIEYLDGAKEKAEYYLNNPQEHLKDLFNRKLSGLDG